MGNARIPKIYAEVIRQGEGVARQYQHYLELIRQGDGAARVFSTYAEVLAFSLATARIGQQYLEILADVGQVAIDRDVESTLVLTQTIVVNKTLNLEVDQTLTLTHLASVLLPQEVTSTLTLTQAIVCNTTQNEAVTSTLSFTQDIDVSVTRNLSVTSVLTLTHSNVVGRNIPLSVSQTIPLTDDIELRDEIISHLTLTQEILAGAVRSRDVESTLNLTQNIVVHGTYNRSVSHTIQFNSSRPIDNGFGGDVDVPGIIATLIRDHVVLQSHTPNTVIVLPSAEFGDAEQGTSRINVKRSMDGDRRVTFRRSPTRKLSYSFVIDRLKAIELRSFILNNSSKPLTMTNWKAEIWEVKLVNNPFSFSEDAYWDGPYGNKCTITLEFEGVKLN